MSTELSTSDLVKFIMEQPPSKELEMDYNYERPGYPGCLLIEYGRTLGFQEGFAVGNCTIRGVLFDNSLGVSNLVEAGVSAKAKNFAWAQEYIKKHPNFFTCEPSNPS